MKRIYSLDLLRFIAALMVVGYHYGYSGYNTGMLELEFPVLKTLFEYGNLGVPLFFLISGFSIAFNLAHQKGTNFIISRVARLYPAYWLAVTLTAFFLFFSNQQMRLHDYLWNLTMFQNYFGVANLDPVYWTLLIEMKFYLLVVWVLITLKKYFNLSISNGVMVWTVLTVLFILFPQNTILKTLNSFIVLDWSAYFIGGIAACKIYQEEGKRKHLVLMNLTYFIAMYYQVFAFEAGEIIGWKTDAGIRSIYITSFYGVILMIALKVLKPFEKKQFQRLGAMTYSLYLIHQIIGFGLMQLGSIYLGKWTVLTVTFLLMVGISYLIGNYFEPWAIPRLKRVLSKLVLKGKLIEK